MKIFSGIFSAKDLTKEVELGGLSLLLVGGSGLVPATGKTRPLRAADSSDAAGLLLHQQPVLVVQSQQPWSQWESSLLPELLLSVNAHQPNKTGFKEECSINQIHIEDGG